MRKISKLLVGGFLLVLMVFIVTSGYCQARKKVDAVTNVKENVSRGIEAVKSQTRSSLDALRNTRNKALGTQRKPAPRIVGDRDNPDTM